MTKQLLIYERATPITVAKHGGWSVKTGESYDFARDLSSAPLMASEIAVAVADYPIVFAGNEEDVMPAVVLGLRPKQNLFVDEAGGWVGGYVPAFLRQYPFVFAAAEDGETLTLCLDEAFEGCNQEGRGERLFDAEGERTVYLSQVLEFAQTYQRDFHRTRAFTAKLRELDLLEPMRAQVSVSGQNVAVQGFLAVSRERLRKIGDTEALELFRNDGLELIYAHLASLAHFQGLARRAEAAADAVLAGDVEESVEA